MNVSIHTVSHVTESQGIQKMNLTSETTFFCRASVSLFQFGEEVLVTKVKNVCVTLTLLFQKIAVLTQGGLSWVHYSCMYSEFHLCEMNDVVHRLHVVSSAIYIIINFISTAHFTLKNAARSAL